MSRSVLALLGLSAAAGILLFSHSTVAFQGYRLLKLNGQHVKWGDPVVGTGAVVTYAFARQRMSFDGAINCRTIVPIDRMLERSRLSQVQFGEAFARAASRWEAAAQIRFKRVDDPRDAGIIIGAQAEPKGWAYTNVAPHEVARADVVTIDRSLICFNPERLWKVGFDGNTKVYDLGYVAMHELGHAIGLDHPGPSGEVMSFAYSERFVGLQPGDITGVEMLYGGPARHGKMPQNLASASK